MEKINLILDFILILTAFWMISVAKDSIGGMIGKAFASITWGTIVLGLAHIAETITFEVFHWEVDVVEFAHRVIVLAGFVLLVMGFKKVKALKGPTTS